MQAQQAITDLPAGMIQTASGRVLKDDGYGQLIDTLDAIYELNDHVVTTVLGHIPEVTFLGDHMATDGSVDLATFLTVSPSNAIEQTAQSKDGAYCSATFRIDGNDVVLGWTDPYDPRRPN